MSFASAAASFAAKVARERQALGTVRVQPYTSAGVADGAALDVFLTSVRADREMTQDGFVTVHQAELRVLKTSSWQPVEGAEFVVLATSERFRCKTAAGADSDFAAEIVCQVRRLNP